jgi:hypothetical protein
MRHGGVMLVGVRQTIFVGHFEDSPVTVLRVLAFAILVASGGNTLSAAGGLYPKLQLGDSWTYRQIRERHSVVNGPNTTVFSVAYESKLAWVMGSSLAFDLIRLKKGTLPFWGAESYPRKSAQGLGADAVVRAPFYWVMESSLAFDLIGLKMGTRPFSGAESNPGKSAQSLGDDAVVQAPF